MIEHGDRTPRRVFLSILIALLFAMPVLASEKPPVFIAPLEPVKVKKPDHVIGNGSPKSVTEEALHAAFKSGGFITFDTGGKPCRLTLKKQLYMPVNTKPIVLDGKGLVTLDGDNKTRLIMKAWKTKLTVQRLRFINARAPKEGAAIKVENWDGYLTVIDCQFENCKTTEAGPDIGGGAIRPTGQKHFIVSGCSFNNCAGSNGGAICQIGCQLTIINSSFTHCEAFGYGGGADAVPHGGKGQGGIGGAVYVDGVDQNADEKQLYISGCLFKDNQAGDHAGAVFGYTRPNQNSLSVYNACVFLNNKVTAARDLYCGHAGAVYSQYSRLYVLNCSFGNNSCPKIDGALFVAAPVSMRVANCEFYGNGPEWKERGDTARIFFEKQKISPAEKYLGRYPGSGPSKPSILGNVVVKHCTSQAKSLERGGSVAPALRALDGYAQRDDDKGKEAKALAQTVRGWVESETTRLLDLAKTAPAQASLDLPDVMKRVSGLPEHDKLKALQAELNADKHVRDLARLLQDIQKTRKRISKKGTSKSLTRKLAGIKKKLETLASAGDASAAVKAEAEAASTGL